MQPQPFSISLGDEEIPCEMQVELAHMTLEEAIASGLFELPDEPGTVQIPVTVHVSIPNHLLWPTQASPPLPPVPHRAVGDRSGFVPIGDGARRRFGNYPKAIAAQRIAESIRSTLGFYHDEEAAAFRAMLATVNAGRSRAAPAERFEPDDDASGRRTLSTPDGTPVQLARDEAGPVEDEPGTGSGADAPASEFGPVLQPATQQPVEIERHVGVAGAAGLPGPRLPSFQAGESDGGPGVWVLKSPKYPYGNPKAAAYQQHATGAPEGMEYLLTGVPTRFMSQGKKYFDGYDPQNHTLIDAKGYFDWPKEELGFSMKETAKELAKEADIAKHFGCGLEIRVATQEKTDLLKSIIKGENIKNVVVRLWPPL